MSSGSDADNPIQWTWPEPGEDDPPYAVESTFGPVSLDDSMVLTFTPASYTGILILYCSWQDGNQGVVWTIYNNKGSPFTYHFNETTQNAQDPEDLHVCHFLQPTNEGNTQTFQYLNTPAKQPVLWQEDGATIITSSADPSPITSTVGSGSSTGVASASASASTGSSSGKPSSSGVDLPASTSSSPASSSSSPPALPQPTSSGGLSAGAAVGITIGAVAALLAIGLAAFCLRKRRRASRQGGQSQFGIDLNPGDSQPTAGPGYGPGYGPLPMNPGSDSRDAKLNETRRLGELDGQGMSEMDRTRLTTAELPGS